MKLFQPKSLLLLSLLTGSALCLIAAGGKHAEWGYDGEIGPEFWGDLDSAYALCRDGLEQSPVDLVATARRTNKPLEIHWGKSTLNLVNNGHTIQANYDPGSYVEFDGMRFDLLQFHFHRKSEHTIHGKHSAMEAHFVHATEDGQLLVVGVMLNQGLRGNKFLDQFWNQIPTGAGETVESNQVIDANELLPDRPTLYHYMGSLTTPPGTEGVRWFVFNEPSRVSGGQIRNFSRLFPNNFRPVQELNGRTITLLHATRGE